MSGADEGDRVQRRARGWAEGAVGRGKGEGLSVKILPEQRQKEGSEPRRCLGRHFRGGHSTAKQGRAQSGLFVEEPG